METGANGGSWICLLKTCLFSLACGVTAWSGTPDLTMMALHVWSECVLLWETLAAFDVWSNPKFYVNVFYVFLCLFQFFLAQYFILLYLYCFTGLLWQTDFPSGWIKLSNQIKNQIKFNVASQRQRWNLFWLVPPLLLAHILSVAPFVRLQK